MKVKYDKEADVIYILFSDKPVNESDEDKPGVILDYAESGDIVGIEILHASKQFPNPTIVEYELA